VSGGQDARRERPATGHRQPEAGVSIEAMARAAPNA
jgi:hypothetical protein